MTKIKHRDGGCRFVVFTENQTNQRNNIVLTPDEQLFFSNNQTPKRNNIVNKSKQTQRPTTKSTNPPNQCRDCGLDVDSELRVGLGGLVWCFLVLFAVWVCSSEFQFLGFQVLFFQVSFWSSSSCSFLLWNSSVSLSSMKLECETLDFLPTSLDFKVKN